MAKSVRRSSADQSASPPKARKTTRQQLGPRPSIPRNPKKSETVALQIVRTIVRQRLKAGERLPSETEMITQYSVSRPSLREALRLLEVQGLIVIRTGPGGGPTVGKISAGNLARTMTLYLHLSETTYEELASAYILVEPLIAELAARNSDRALVRRVLSPYLQDSGECHGRMRDITSGVTFHDSLADLASNHVLYLALNPVSLIFSEHIFSASPDLAILGDQEVDDHKAIAEAVIAGKPELARRLMEKHVKHTVSRFETAWPLRVGEKIRWQ